MKKDSSAWLEVFASKQGNAILKWQVQMVEEHFIDGKNVLCLCVMEKGVKGIIPFPESGIELGTEFYITRSRFNSYLGTNIHFVVVSVDPENDMFIASRRIAMNRIAKRLKLKVGDTKNVTALRVFRRGITVDIEGVEAFLPIQEISYAWVEEIASFTQPGDQFDVKILSIEDVEIESPTIVLDESPDEDIPEEFADIKTAGEISTEPKTKKKLTRKRITVSKKALLPDPRALVAKYYKPNSAYIGTVTGLTQRGVFVALEPYDFGVTAFCNYGVGYGYQVIIPEKGDKVTLACRTISSQNRIYGQILKIIRKAG